MIFFKDPKSGAVLEGVYVRGAQDAKFTLKDFKKARVDQQNKAYEGKHHKVAKEGDTTMGGAKGNYILTTWKEGDKNMEKHTAQHLKDGHRYMVVMWGEKGKVDKKVFDTRSRPSLWRSNRSRSTTTGAPVAPVFFWLSRHFPRGSFRAMENPSNCR